MKKFAVICFAVFMLLSSSAYASVKAGMIGAMDVEVDLLKKAADITRKITKADMEFFEGKLGSTEVVIAKCRMGKVNAGICTQILINLFNVSHVINTGVAGALNDNLNIGDIVIASDAVQYDYDVLYIGFRKGEIPYTGKYAFESDKSLREKALKAAHESLLGVHVIEGRVCTGDQFFSDAAILK